MKKYLFGFIFVLFASAAIVNLKAPAKMPVGVAGVRPSSSGTILDESGVGEVMVDDAARIYRYSEHVTSVHGSRNADFPMNGNN